MLALAFLSSSSVASMLMNRPRVSRCASDTNSLFWRHSRCTSISSRSVADFCQSTSKHTRSFNMHKFNNKQIIWRIWGKGKWIYVVPHTPGAQAWITVLPANYTNACLYLIRIHQSVLSLTCDSVHLIAAYYRPGRIKGWVGLVGCPTVDGLPT